MPYTPWLAGMRITADRQNTASLPGVTVFSAHRTTSQSVPAGTEAAANAIAWDLIDLDVLGGWSAGQPTRWTAPLAGWYQLAGAVSFAASTAGSTREACWFIGGALITAGRARFASGSLANTALTVEARTVTRLLAAGDYVQLVPAQNTAGALDTSTGSYRPFMTVSYAGPA